MGAGKTTLGHELASRLGRRLVDVDAEVERRAGESIPQLFARRGEAAFRELEAAEAVGALSARPPAVIVLGGGGVESAPVREALRGHALTILVEVEREAAWQRVRGGDRPLAQDEAGFRALYERRLPVYRDVADATARDADDAVLAAAGVHVRLGAFELLDSLVPGGGPVALVTDSHVAGILGAAAQLALGARLAETHGLPVGEQAKSVVAITRLWAQLRLDRGGTLVALGGGCTSDAAGFAAATYLRGIPWVPVPTTLVAQVDAAIGGKTALNLPGGKNLVGAFHWPARVVVDPALLETLPQRERGEGMAEVVKTGLLAGAPLWELPDPELVRRAAAFKAGVCLRDPHEAGERAILNLGHTFAHALEAGGGYGEVTHGRAVALGLLAALRLSGRPTDVVEDVLRPRPVGVDRDRAWEALQRDKKARDGEIRLVLLGADGAVVEPVPAADVRAALDELIASR